MTSNKTLPQDITTDPRKGLSEKEVAERQKKFGLNDLSVQFQQTSFFTIFLRQFNTIFIYILLAAAVLKIIVEDYRDGIVIIGVTIINSLIGAIQEKRSYTILATLKKFLPSNVVVLREGNQDIISTLQLVPGDIILLSEGDRIPADAHILSSEKLTLDEAVQTGESESVHKGVHNPILHMGTTILTGSCVAVITATGARSSLGKLHAVTGGIDYNIPLKNELDELATVFLVFTIIACIGLIFLSLYRGLGFMTTILTLTSLFVSIVPTSIPIIATIVLAIGTYHMAKSNVLVKRLSSIETLGHIDTLVVDKTGTLTYNQQMIVSIYVNGKFYTVSGKGYAPAGEIYDNNGVQVMSPIDNPEMKELGTAAALLNRSLLEFDAKKNTYILKGEPIQAALGVLAQKIGIKKEELQKHLITIKELVFDVNKRFSGGYFKNDTEKFSYLMGSPEDILHLCVDSKGDQTINAALKSMLHKGLRVIALAKSFDDGDHIKKASFLGLVGMQDAIRPHVNSLVEQAKNAQLRVIMATGDHQETAEYVGRETGIFKEGNDILTGKDFHTLSDEELYKKLKTTTVIARVTPKDKLAIISAFRHQGHSIAMTGDGVNDVPALMVADVGIAMGQSGSDIAIDAADIVLLDDSIQSIFTGIAQGRALIFILRRALTFLIIINISEVSLIMLTLIFNFPLPLLATQILWQHLLTDNMLGIGISFEPAETTLLRSPSNSTTFFTSRMLAQTYSGIIIAVGCTLALFIYYSQYTNIALARTMVLVTFTCFQWCNAWNLRSDYRSIFTMNPFGNLWLLGMTLSAIIAQYLAVTLPTFNEWLELTPLTSHQWLIAFCTAFSIVVYEEIRKIFIRKNMRKKGVL